MEFPPRDIGEKAAGYGSAAVAKAHELTVGWIIEALPGPGAGGRILVEKWCEGDQKKILECPEEMVKDPAEEPRRPE